MLTLKKAVLGLASLTLLAASTVSSHDFLPGTKQEQPILLKNGTIHTVENGVIKQGDLLFVNGVIKAVGTVSDYPSNTQIIDVAGKQIYPSFIALNSTLGLTEISSVRATRDFSEVGSINPDVQARVAFNADSELIPTVRSNGISYVQVVPQGKLLTGTSSVMSLDSWNWQDAVVKADDGIHLSWPKSGVNSALWEKRSPEKQREATKEQLKTLKQHFVSARAYFDGYQADKTIAKDSRWHAMMPLFTKAMTLYVHADDRRQIEQAIEFANEQGFKLAIVGGQDAWKITDLLVKHNVSVIFEQAFGLPSRDDEAFDQAYKTPKMLADAKVSFAITIPGDWGSRSLAFAAGQAINYGITPEKALESITLAPAKILNIDESSGSLVVGKRANIIISKGDVFDYLGHGVELMFIDGRMVDLNNRHKQLYQKYSQKQSE